MTVNSIEKAWIAANEIFPTDYLKDEKASANAGYPVYRSTADGVNAWISDLGNRLEVNMEDGRSINIWIEEEPEEAKEKGKEEYVLKLSRLEICDLLIACTEIKWSAKFEKENDPDCPEFRREKVLPETIKKWSALHDKIAYQLDVLDDEGRRNRKV